MVLDPEATVADGVTFGFNLGNLTAGQLRELLSTYEMDGDPAETDQLLVESGAVGLTGGSSGPAPQGCEALRRPVRAAPDSRVELYARTGAPEVRVRRFGPDWVAIGRLQERRVATLALPGYASGEAWALTATQGVCVSVMPG